MNYTVLIRENATGVECEYRSLGVDWDIHSPFFWSEGNGSCDCNRAIFCGVHFDDAPCGESAYSVTKITLDDGTDVTYQLY